MTKNEKFNKDNEEKEEEKLIVIWMTFELHE